MLKLLVITLLVTAACTPNGAANPACVIHCSTYVEQLITDKKGS